MENMLTERQMLQVILQQYSYGKVSILQNADLNHNSVSHIHLYIYIYIIVCSSNTICRDAQVENGVFIKLYYALHDNISQKSCTLNFITTLKSLSKLTSDD